MNLGNMPNLSGGNLQGLQGQSLNNLLGGMQSNNKKTAFKQEMRMQLQTVIQWPQMQLSPNAKGYGNQPPLQPRSKRMNPYRALMNPVTPNQSQIQSATPSDENEDPIENDTTDLELPHDPVIEDSTGEEQ